MPTDLWKKKDGSRSAEHGKGTRYRISWPGPDGKTLTERWPGNYQSAVKEESKRRSDADNGGALDYKAGKLTIEHASSIWRDSRPGWRPATRKYVGGVFRNMINPHIGQVRVADARKMTVERMVLAWESQYAASTIRVAVELLGSLYRSLIQNKAGVTTSPTIGITLPPAAKGDYWIPSPGLLQRFLREFPERYQLAIAIAAGCGLRHGEVMGLTTKDVSLDLGRVYVRHQLKAADRGEVPYLGPAKTEDSVRWVPMPPTVRALLATHLAHPEWMATLDIEDRIEDINRRGVFRNVTLLFAGRPGEAMRDTRWRRMWRKVRDGMPEMDQGFTMHGLRHMFVSTLIEAGRSITKIQKLVGHKTPAITLNTYSHWFDLYDSSRNDEAAVLEEMFAAGLDTLSDEDGPAAA